MITYLDLTPNVNGTVNDVGYETEGVREGMAVIPDRLLPIWNQYKPFVTLTVIDGAITNIEDNPTARAEFLAIPIPVPEPTAEEKLRADVDYLAMVTGVSL